MGHLFDVATSIKTPLAFGGFVAAILFWSVRQIVAKDIFPKLSSGHGADLLRLIVDRLFVLALVSTVLGVVSYLAISLFPHPDLTHEDPIAPASQPYGASPIQEYRVAGDTALVPTDTFGVANGDVFVQARGGLWNEIHPPGTTPLFVFKELSRGEAEVMLFDISRNMYLRLPRPSGVSQWRVGTAGEWTAWLNVDYHP